MSLLVASCARFPAQPQARVERPLPTSWEALGSSAQWGAHCGKPQAVGLELWTFCDGAGSVHGSLRRAHLPSGVRSVHEIRSRDPLALAVSVSAQTSWTVGPEAVWAGTQDGRVLKFNFRGELVATHEFELHAWLKDLHFDGERLFALSALHRRVRVVALDPELTLQHTAPVTEALYLAQLRVSAAHVVVASDRGVLREYSPQLTLVRQWDLARGRELGAPLVTTRGIWVGDETGTLHHVTATSHRSQALSAGSSITSAPIDVAQGVWVASDEEGRLRLVDDALRTIRVVAIPFQRTLLELRPFSFAQHRLLEVTSNGLVSLVDEEGTILLSQESPGEFSWEIRPAPVVETLMSERLPASVEN